MAAIRNALVIGGGTAGAASAILLSLGGIGVDLVELKREATDLGSGITLQGNALRVLRDLGVWEQVRAQGFPFDTIGLRAPDLAGTLLVEMKDARMGGPDLPATLGINRPTLARILIDRAAAVGAKIHLGKSVESLRQNAEGVSVKLGDGHRARYDVVIGADGFRSWTRRYLGIPLDTRSTGMGIWRVLTRRPASVVRTDLFYGGPCYIAGYCPTGLSTMYAYLVEDAQERSKLSPRERLATVRRLAEAYHGPWDEIRESLVDPSLINYTWFETHLLEPPWNRGRVVLIGDAVHLFPPTLAQGAAMALEDASVLAELLLGKSSLEQRLWDEFIERRFARVKATVDASLQLGQWQLDRVRDADIPGLIARIAGLLSQPA